MPKVVRTAAGVKRYDKPIGTLLSGGSGRTRTTSAQRSAANNKETERRITRAVASGGGRVDRTPIVGSLHGDSKYRTVVVGKHAEQSRRQISDIVKAYQSGRVQPARPAKVAQGAGYGRYGYLSQHDAIGAEIQPLLMPANESGRKRVKQKYRVKNNGYRSVVTPSPHVSIKTTTKKSARRVRDFYG